jgi:sterol desaturase/sphingolipid hydroxylase (fatty acid hydroxylase superfamily)
MDSFYFKSLFQYSFNQQKKTMYSYEFYYYTFIPWIVNITIIPAFIYLLSKLEQPTEKPKDFEITFFTNYIGVSVAYSILFTPLWTYVDQNNEFTILKLITLRLLHDFFAYTIHYLFHTKYLYHLHKKHHYWNKPIAMSFVYASKTEMVFNNLTPLFLSAWLAGLTPLWFTIFLTIGTMSSIAAHSSYDLLNNRYHWLHHQHQHMNYGSDVFMDRLFKTYM